VTPSKREGICHNGNKIQGKHRRKKEGRHLPKFSASYGSENKKPVRRGLPGRGGEVAEREGFKGREVFNGEIDQPLTEEGSAAGKRIHQSGIA